MKDRRVMQLLAALAVVLLVISVSGLSGAQAQTAAVSPSQAPAVKAPAPVTAPAFPNAAPGDAVMSVVGSLLKPTSSNVAFAVSMEGGLYCAGNVVVLFNTPVNLPQGTLVKSLRMYFYDVDPLHYCEGFFYWSNLNGSSGGYGVAYSPVGALGVGHADSDAINHTIDNTQYSYGLAWRASESDSAYGLDLQLRSLQLNYTPPPSANKTVVIPLN